MGLENTPVAVVDHGWNGENQTRKGRKTGADLGRVLINLGRPVGLAMSALPSEADIRANLQQVCFGPIADIS
jgi:hypothetical protein